MPSATPKRPELALWLVPAREDAAGLQRRIRELAGRFTTSLGQPPVFRPHITVFGGLTVSRERALGAVEAMARSTPPLSLTPAGFGHSPRFFQSFFLRFTGGEVETLRRRFGPELGKDPAEAAEPHLSLLYAELDAPTRQALVEREEPPANPITFDAIEIIAPADHPAGWSDVAGWRCVARRSLAA